MRLGSCWCGLSGGGWGAEGEAFGGGAGAWECENVGAESGGDEQPEL